MKKFIYVSERLDDNGQIIFDTDKQKLSYKLRVMFPFENIPIMTLCQKPAAESKQATRKAGKGDSVIVVFD